MALLDLHPGDTVVDLGRGTGIRSFRLPAVPATASLEMVPEYDDVVSDLARQLEPTRGRLTVGGVRRCSLPHCRPPQVRPSDNTDPGLVPRRE